MEYPSSAYNDNYNYFPSQSVEEPESVYKINSELNLAHRLIEETASNLFLTGKAGTGKTTFLKRLRLHSSKRMIVLAPTGVAAINADGSTIHSFFQLSFSPFIPGRGFVGEANRKYSFSKEKRRIIAALDLLVIDEISMVRPDTLDAIDSIMRRYRNPTLPFGGAQLLLIGDLRQLAPVLKEREREILSPYYASEYFFESHALKQSGFVTIELTNVYRQADPKFINILNAVREGMIDAEHLKLLNSRYIPGFESENEGYIRLTTHNRMADNINMRRLEMIKGAGEVYNAHISGTFPESAYPAEPSLRLKIGARVMFIKNDSGEDRKYYNGMLGTVTALSQDWVTVMPDNGNEPLSVQPVEWENTKYVINEKSKEIMQITEGIFSQIPLRLAWAITIHKSQGLTFERAMIDAGASFAPGQTYVALSRCRSIDGLVLGEPLSISAIITDQKVNNFIADSAAKRPDEKTLEHMRAAYTRHILSELFDFRAAKVAFDDYHRAVSEFVIPLYPEYYTPFREASEIMARQIDQIGAKFAVLYASEPIPPEKLNTHPEFLEKIRKGCGYFIPLLEKVIATVNGVNVSLSNNSYVIRLSNLYDNAFYQLLIKTALLKRLSSTDFSPPSYIRAKAEAVIEASNPKASGKLSASDKTSREKRKRKESSDRPKKEKKPVGYSKHVSFEMFKSGKSIEEIAQERELAPSTIAGHLTEFVVVGEIFLEELISPERLILIREAFDQFQTPKEVKEFLGEKVEYYEIKLCYSVRSSQLME